MASAPIPITFPSLSNPSFLTLPSPSSFFGPSAPLPKIDTPAKPAAASGASVPSRPLNTLRTSAMTFPPSGGSLDMPRTGSSTCCLLTTLAPKPAPPKEVAKPAPAPELVGSAPLPKPKAVPSQVTQNVHRWNMTINNQIQQYLIMQQSLLAKEKQLLADRSRIEEVQGAVRSAERSAASMQEELARSWKELSKLEALEDDCIRLPCEKMSDARNHGIDAAMDLISSLNALNMEGDSVLRSARTREAEECQTMHAEKNLQEMLTEHENLLRSIENDIRILSAPTASQQTSASTPQLNRVPSSPVSSRYPVSSSPSPALPLQLLRTRSTPVRSTGSHFSNRSIPMSQTSFDE